MNTLVELVRKLERISESMENSHFKDLQNRLEKRQEILTQIQTADGSGLPEATRKELRDRIVSVLRRDVKFISILSAARDDAEKSLKTMASTKVALKGYRQNGGGHGESIRRTV